MLFKSLLATFVVPFALAATSGKESAQIGAVVVTPIDYATYSSTIDLQRVRYNTKGELYFYDKTVKNPGNDTKTITDAVITADGLLQIDAENKQYFLGVDPASGKVSVTTDNSTTNGLFSISNDVLSFGYHSTFVACKQGTDSSSNHKYTLIWRGASSVAQCQNEWLLVNLKTYSSSSGAVSEYIPNGYQTAIAATATENLNTQAQAATAVASATGASSSSANAAMGLTVSSGAMLALAAYLL